MSGIPGVKTRLNILIACEHSGAIRDAFRSRDDRLFEAWSNDLEDIPAEGEWSNYHLYGDCLHWLANPPWGGWDLIIAHPPCTYVSGSGWHWNSRPEGIASGRPAKSAVAIEFARKLIDTSAAAHVAVENPIGVLSSHIRKPDQIVQPWQFGDDASKATCLWLKGLPKLEHNTVLEQCLPRLVMSGGKVRKRWANQTDSGQNKLGPSDDRWKERSKTYPGIAKAVANQWGDYLCQVYGLAAPARLL